MIKSFIHKHPYGAAIIAAVLCTILTAVGAAAAQIADLEDAPAYLIMSATVACSAVIGLLLVARSGHSPAFYGFRRPAAGSLSKVWLFVPLLLLELVPLVLYGPTFKEAASLYAVLALFTILVGLNEELYFRGLVLGFLRKQGPRAAVIGSAVIFGVLHAINALGGSNLWEVLLQIAFAFLAGLVLALLVNITGSLWIGILWHIVHNFISFGSEGALDRTALTVAGIQVLILLVYSVGLWKQGTRE
ncbi:MAG: Abortive infection protein [Paenibacillaceae bacterium]|jgi:membrane protease YdiL (CAAX protease family)|nr:Abortive infection protein [Paenibacillaceae bacterium]